MHSHPPPTGGPRNRPGKGTTRDGHHTAEAHLMPTPFTPRAQDDRAVCGACATGAMGRSYLHGHCKRNPPPLPKPTPRVDVNAHVKAPL